MNRRNRGEESMRDDKFLNLRVGVRGEEMRLISSSQEKENCLVKIIRRCLLKKYVKLIFLILSTLKEREIY